MAVARRQLNATLMADGTVLVTGGSNSPGFNMAPTDSRVLTAGAVGSGDRAVDVARRHGAPPGLSLDRLLLPDGRLLSAGSGAAGGARAARTTTPRRSSRRPTCTGIDGTLATRPVITDAPTEVSYGQAIHGADADAANIVRATWIRLSSVTHAFNQNQRMNNLTVSASGPTSVLVNAPSSANLGTSRALHAVPHRRNGVPSVSKIIRIH